MSGNSNQSPRYESVSIDPDTDTIIFVDSDGNEGEITPYGAVLHDQPEAETSEEIPYEEFPISQSGTKRGPEISELPEEERLRYDGSRTARNVYGNHGQVPKDKK